MAKRTAISLYSKTGSLFKRYREEIFPESAGQNEFAEKIGVSRSKYRSFESGARTPSDKDLRLLAKGYKIPLKRLLDEVAEIKEAEAKERRAKLLCHTESFGSSAENLFFDAALTDEEYQKFWNICVGRLPSVFALAFALLDYRLTSLSGQLYCETARTEDEKTAHAADLHCTLGTMGKDIRAFAKEVAEKIAASSKRPDSSVADSG